MTIESIHIKNVFKHKDTFIPFNQGINYLVGPNESGKTVILEMILYSLFGTPVLRSEASDYKNSEITMIFTVNGIKYKVDRNKKTILYKYNSKDLEPIAVGISPVNKHISELLGYDSSVFFKLNYSSQLDGHSHATASKSERTNLINKINGIDEATKLEKYLESKRRSLKSEIKGLSTSLTMSDIQWVPNPSLEYLTEEDSQSYKAIVNVSLDQVSILQQQLSALDVIPTLSEEEKQTLALLSNTYYNNAYDTLDYKGIQSYHLSLKPHYEAYIAQQDVINTYTKYIEQHSIYINESLVTKEYLEELELKLEANKNYNEKQKLLKQGNITCPSCQSSFPLSIDRINSIQNADVFYEVPSDIQVNSYRRFITNHYNTVVEYKDILENMEIKEFSLTEYKKVCSDFSRYEQLTIKKSQLDLLTEKYNKTFDSTPRVELLSSIQMLLSKINKNKQKYEDLDRYLQEKAIFKNTLIFKEQVKSKIGSYSKYIEDISSTLDKSKDLRLFIQNSCIPSLNKKASNIINKMTGAQHYSLNVSDTFELLLDDNLLAKFSGSTQVISSVAFRIALMDLFYKKTFPVFIGDEIDSFTDDDRAGFVRDAFSALTKDGYQLILISHFKQEDLVGNIININEYKKE